MTRLLTQRAIVRAGIGIAVAGLALAAGSTATAGARAHRSLQAEATPRSSAQPAIVDNTYAAVAPSAAKIALTLSGKKTVGLPATLTPGYHAFLLKQKGPNIRDLVIVRFTDASYDVKKLGRDINALFASQTFAAKAYHRVVGRSTIAGTVSAAGAGIVGPEVGLSLKADSTYFFLNTPDSNNGPNVVTVVKTVGAASSVKPRYTATIRQREFAFGETGLKAGTQLVRVQNVGAQIHELGLALITDPTKTEQDAVDAIESGGPDTAPPAWLQEAGFGGFHTPKDTEYLKLHLNHGDRLLLVCFMPDATSGGTPHVFRGMHKLVTIP